MYLRIEFKIVTVHAQTYRLFQLLWTYPSL